MGLRLAWQRLRNPQHLASPVRAAHRRRATVQASSTAAVLLACCTLTELQRRRSMQCESRAPLNDAGSRRAPAKPPGAFDAPGSRSRGAFSLPQHSSSHAGVVRQPRQVGRVQACDDGDKQRNHSAPTNSAQTTGRLLPSAPLANHATRVLRAMPRPLLLHSIVLHVATSSTTQT